MSIDWSLVLTVLMSILPLLSLVFIVLKKFFPVVDPYLMKGTVILAEIDDIIDALLIEYPDREYLLTIDEITDKVLKGLKEAGYSLDKEEKRKVNYHLKGKLKKEGLKIDWIDGEGIIQYNKRV